MSNSLVDFFREQRKLELSHIDSLRSTLKLVSDRLATALLEGIIYDSRKHAALCQVLIEIESEDVSPEMDVGDVVDTYHAVEEHVEVEAEMMKRLESLRGKVKGDRERAIINYMLSDERRHHSTLKRMADLLSQSDLEYGKYLNLMEKYLYPGPDHGHKEARY